MDDLILTNYYDREQVLKFRLNGFLRSRFGLPEGDYYARLEQNDLAELKSVLNDINNIFTLKVTVAFIHWLSTRLGLDETTRARIMSNVLSTKPNANGYDIKISDPIEVVAEVKCNVPVNCGTVYGAAQRNGIAKDISSLIHGKSKSFIDPKMYKKFMVFLDTPEIRQATQHFVKNMKKDQDRIVLVDTDVSIDSLEKVYVVFVRF